MITTQHNHHVANIYFLGFPSFSCLCHFLKELSALFIKLGRTKVFILDYNSTRVHVAGYWFFFFPSFSHLYHLLELLLPQKIYESPRRSLHCQGVYYPLHASKNKCCWCQSRLSQSVVWWENSVFLSFF